MENNKQNIIDELKEYREKLSSLTEEEQKQRDLYLKQLADGTLQGPPTGYSSIDKQWLKFYDAENIISDIPKKTIYQFRYEQNKEFPNDVALNYFGLKISNKTYEKKIDETAKALKSLGVEKGDIISICSVNTPETGYLMYAANKIGAIVDLFDPRTNQAGVKNYIEKSNSKYLFVLDNFLDNMYESVQDTSIEKIIHISPYDSIPSLFRILNSLKKKNEKEQLENDRINNVVEKLEKNKNVINWKTFIGNRNKHQIITPVDYEENAVAAIVHTGGTTGLPKGVQLTNENFIAEYLNYKAVDFDLARNDKFLDILVPWVAYGLVFTFFVASCLNLEHILIPSFSPEMLPQLLLKYKPNQILGIPAYYEKLLDSELMKGQDLSHLKLVASGGDHISPDLEVKLNNFLEEHNSKAKFVKGYGMTELSSSACTCLENVNEISSVGVPLVKNSISIFDPETLEEKKYNERGEICIKSPTMMKGYDDVEKNNGVMVKHNDGDIWIHSGDIGYMTENGTLFIVDRIKRMIIRKGFKVYPVEIEKVITSHPAIDSCAVVGIPNIEDVNTPKAFMVLNKEYKEKEEFILNEVKKLLVENLPEYEIPYDSDYEFIDSIPHTSLGKVDFKKLIEESKEEKIKSR